MESFDKLKKIIADAEADAVKVDAGVSAAATRLRKAMQDVKSAAQQIRVDALTNTSKDGVDKAAKGVAHRELGSPATSADYDDNGTND